jgi:hypothetical protein
VFIDSKDVMEAIQMIKYEKICEETKKNKRRCNWPINTVNWPTNTLREKSDHNISRWSLVLVQTQTTLTY